VDRPDAQGNYEDGAAREAAGGGDVAEKNGNGSAKLTPDQLLHAVMMLWRGRW